MRDQNAAWQVSGLSEGSTGPAHPLLTGCSRNRRREGPRKLVPGKPRAAPTSPWRVLIPSLRACRCHGFHPTVCVTLRRYQSPADMPRGERLAANARQGCLAPHHPPSLPPSRGSARRSPTPQRPAAGRALQGGAARRGAGSAPPAPPSVLRGRGRHSP